MCTLEKVSNVGIKDFWCTKLFYILLYNHMDTDRSFNSFKAYYINTVQNPLNQGYVFKQSAF